MNIFLRSIFINCFLLVAMHSLIIAREGNENDSDNQSLINKTTEIVDDTHPVSYTHLTLPTKA